MSVLVKVSTLMNLTNMPSFDPFDTRKKITFSEIGRFIRDNNLRKEASTALSHNEHVARIAYLAVNGWNDAIQIDVGIPSLQCYIGHIVIDGNHRLLAAAYRKDEFISADVSGSCSYAEEILGVKI